MKDMTVAVVGLLAALGLGACGGRSSLDDFAAGAPGIFTDPGSGAPGTPSDGGATPGADAGSGLPADAGPVTGTQAIGDSCAMDSDCEGEATCVTSVSVMGFEIPFPGGYCQIRECQADDDCPEGSGCIMAMGTNACLATCDMTSDCREDEGYQCAALGGAIDYCLPGFGAGGGGAPGGPGGGGFDPSQLCAFLCQDPVDILRCVENGGDFQNLPDGCRGPG